MTKEKKIANTEFGVDSRYSSKATKKIAGKALMESRLERMKNLTPDQILRAKLIQLKLRMAEYLLKPIYKEHNYFTEFLCNYIDAIYERRNKFAEDIDISPVKLSQILNNHREPQEEFFLRLMVHSELTFKNICKFDKSCWYQVYFHEKICDTISSQDKWRPDVEKHVKTRHLIPV